MILGHNHPEVLEAVQKTVIDGSSFGLPTKREVELAELVIDCMSSIEKLRLTTSGTEACMTAVRLARAFTKRNKIIKFAGCYHGHSDSLLVKAGSEALTYNTMDSNGITEGVVKDTITFEYNYIEGLKKIFSENKEKIACVIIEPIAANMGLVLPGKDFLKNLREITERNGSLLIFDEVISGFRIGIDGAQGYFGIKPDLTVLGKIIGGGYPISAFGGRKEIMNMISPEGNVYHAGTLSGNPVSVAAGLATIGFLKKNKGIYKELEVKTRFIIENVEKSALKNGVKVNATQFGSLFTLFYADKKVNNLKDTEFSDVEKFKKYFSSLLDNGIIVPASQFEAHFVSLAHSKEDLEYTVSVITNFFEKDYE